MESASTKSAHEAMSLPLRDRLAWVMSIVTEPQISPSWMHDAVRHYERNVPFDEPADGGVPDRQSGEAFAVLYNSILEIWKALPK